jgi:hypothetical protein
MFGDCKDFEIIDGGSVLLLIPLTDEGRRWIDESIGEDATYFGNGLAVERRFIDQIVGGILSDGLGVGMKEQ